MFLGAYHFDGEHDTLLASYNKLVDGFPPDAFDLHACLVTPRGITVLDACPSRDVFERFSVSDEFLGAVRDAGLPRPRVEPLGDVERAIVHGDTVV
jgi:hypothetical protein